MLDYAAFSMCFSGPGDGPDFAPPSEDCLTHFDTDRDDDIDKDDYVCIAGGMTGPQ